MLGSVGLSGRMFGGNPLALPLEIRRRIGGRRILRLTKGSACTLKNATVSYFVDAQFVSSVSKTAAVFMCNDWTVARAGSDKMWFK